jgi:hypothetical protein
MNGNLYDEALATAVSRPEWDEKTEVTLWRGTVQGKPTRIYLKRDGGFVGIHFALGIEKFIEQFSVAMLTDEGWQLLAWANKANYNTWVGQVKTWLERQKKRRRVTQFDGPALWVTPPQ